LYASISWVEGFSRKTTRTLTASLFAGVLTSIFATGALAEHVYHGAANDNPDLSAVHAAPTSGGPAGAIVQAFDVYHGLAQCNQDLSPAGAGAFDPAQARLGAHGLPAIYGGFGGGPELTF
jgi:hypothetical protein